MHVGARGSRGDLHEVGKRFLLDGDDGDIVAGFSSGVEDEKRKAPVSRDET